MQRNDNQIKHAWEAFHKSFEFNIIPVGHQGIYALALEAHTDPHLRVKLADYFEVAPAQVSDRLRGYLKQPTFSSEIRKLLGTFIPHYADRAVNSIPSLASVTCIRKPDDKNTYLHFYDQRIEDPIAEKMIQVYGGMATGVAVLLRESDQLTVIDFDDRETLIELLNQLGYPCDETTLEQTLLRVFPKNPIVATYRGFHVYGFDEDLAEAVKTRREIGKIEIRVSRCYLLLPPSLAGFQPSGATLIPIHYRQVRPMLPETIREPLPTQIRDYLLAQIRPQTVSTTLNFAPTPQPTTSDLKTFVIDSLLPYWKRGVRDILTYTLAGVLRRAGITLNAATDIVATICDRASDEEKRDRLYQVRRQYSLPFQPNGNSPFCAGVSKFREACLTAGMPLQVFNTLIARIFGFKLTTNLLDWLSDHKQIAEKIAAIVRNDMVFNEKTMSWWVYREEDRVWLEVKKKEDLIHYVAKAALEVRSEIEEIVRMSYPEGIPKQLYSTLNRFINAQFIRNNIMPTLEVLLSVNLEFPHIPPEVAKGLPAPVTRITAHQNGVLLWLENGDTIFVSEDDPHRRFYITQTLPSIVDETADPQPYLDFVSEIVNDRETAEFLLQMLATVLGLKRNPFDQLILMIGGGSNGKNSFVQTLKSAFGDLTEYTDARILTTKYHDNAVLSAKAALKDCAFAIIDEAPSTREWHTDEVKRLAGGDAIKAKRLYKDAETIPVTWITLILTNHFPNDFKQKSYAIARRIVAIHFPNRYTNVKVAGQYLKPKDEKKVRAIISNTPAIIQAFRWAYKEAAQKDFELNEPPKVREFTEPIRLLADNIGHFLENQVIEDPTAFEYLDDLYQAYHKFVKESGLGGAVRKTNFATSLYAANFRKGVKDGRVIILGLRLKDSGQPPQGTIWSTDSDYDDNDSDDEGDGDGQDYLDQFPF
jgi:hypothetical protein